MAVTTAQLQQLYLAYFGRPADFDGIAYYTSQPNIDIWQVAANFGASPESQALYGPGFNASVINAIYQNLFNRDAEPDGLLYWTQQVAAGFLTPGGAALGILLGAQNADLTTINNKLAVAQAFTNAMDTAPEIIGYSGDAAAAIARNFLHTVTADPATVTAAEAQVDATLQAIVDNGGTAGQTVTLTTGVDTFAASNQTFVDTVKGLIDNDGTTDKSTFSVADKITGNGHTVVDVVLKNTTGGGEFVTMSDIAKLHLTNASTANTSLTLDATAWTNVAQVSLDGASGIDVKIDKLTNAAATGIKLNIAGATTGTLGFGTGTKAAHLGTWNVGGYVQNTTANAVGAVASLGSSGFDVHLGKSGYDKLTISQVKSGQGSGIAAKVGDIAFGHVNITADMNATAYTNQIENYASATAAAATVGNVSLGNVSLNAATSATVYLTVTNQAYVNSGKGAATAGNITVGTVTLNAGSGAYVYADLSNSATAQTGNATAGSVTVGDVTLKGTGYASLSISNQANVYGAGGGAATVGNLTVGNITIDGTSGTNSHYLYVYNSASSSKGNATVGNVAVGNVDMTNGDYGYLYVEQSANSQKTGNATSGSTTVGNVVMNATGTGTNYFYLYNSAYAGSGGKGGTATVGDVQVGDVTMSVASSSNYLSIYEYAYNRGTGGAAGTIGNLNVGNVTMNQVAGDGSTNELYIYRSATSAKGSATVGNVTIGDVSINAGGITQANAANTISIYNYAFAGTSGAASVGGISIGNVTAKTGLSGFVKVYASADGTGGTAGSSGVVSVGNVAMQGSKSATMELTLHNYMNGVGDVGGIAAGNISIVGDTSAGVAHVSISDWAQSGDVANVSVGNVALTAANVGLYIDNSAWAGKAGSTSVGNVSLKGADQGGNTNYIHQYGTGAVGTLTVSDVSLTTISGGTLKLQVYNSSTGAAVGAMSLGNINVTLADKDTNAAAGAQASFQAYTNGGKSTGGNITAGDIKIGTSGLSTKAALTAAAAGHVALTSTDGTVTVGNITVTGGIKEAGGAKIAVDNLDTLANWLTLSGSTVTVGNVDYSGYAAASTIDVHTYAGAGTIKASKGGSTISDNKGVNAIDLSANTTKADSIYFASSQTGVKDSGTAGSGGGTITATQTALDTITGFAAGDTIHIGNAGTPVGIGGDSNVIQNTPSQTFAQFLTNAETQITSVGHAAYVAVIQGNTYVALNVGGKVGEIVEVMGVHTFGLDTSTAEHFLTFVS